MNRSGLRTVTVAIASTLFAAWPIVAGAQPVPSQTFTAEQLRTEYVRQGYTADQPVAWWTSNQVTTFRVSDPQRGRVLMVLVYPDVATANAERATAEGTEAPGALSSGAGPHLLPGFGYSTWRQNVALVESTDEELGRLYAAEQARDTQAMTGNSATVEPVPATPTYAVELDFLSAFDQTSVNL